MSVVPCPCSRTLMNVAVSTACSSSARSSAYMASSMALSSAASAIILGPSNSATRSDARTAAGADWAPTRARPRSDSPPTPSCCSPAAAASAATAPQRRGAHPPAKLSGAHPEAPNNLGVECGDAALDAGAVVGDAKLGPPQRVDPPGKLALKDPQNAHEVGVGLAVQCVWQLLFCEKAPPPHLASMPLVWELGPVAGTHTATAL